MNGSTLAREELRSGLKRVLSDVPLRSGHVEVGATWTPASGALLYGEAVAHPLRNLAVFTGATWSRSQGPAVMGGARYTFNW